MANLGDAEMHAMRGFSLVELLVSIAVLVLMSVLMLSVVNSVQKISTETASRTEQYREARRAFERITQRLSQATLHTYWDYVNSAGQPRTAANATTFTPARYARQSELRYLQTDGASLNAPRGGTAKGVAVFFFSPLGQTNSSGVPGMNSLLNTVGYFIEQGSDLSIRPSTITGPAKIRHRLFELVQPTENLTIYSKTSGLASYSGTEWFSTPLAIPANSHRLADNIVALVFEAAYQTEGGVLTKAFLYDSAPRGATPQPIEENNLPPDVKVTMIAVDETSGRRISERNISLTDPKNDTDLSKLEGELTENRLNYQKFESVVKIGASKWSSR